jgi:hypothetical protein
MRGQSGWWGSRSVSMWKRGVGGLGQIGNDAGAMGSRSAAMVETRRNARQRWRGGWWRSGGKTLELLQISVNNLMFILKCKHQIWNYQHENEKSAVASVTGDTRADCTQCPIPVNTLTVNTFVSMYGNVINVITTTGNFESGIPAYT